jgi:hypothetical protein
MNREQLEQKILVCQELATKAALRGLCHVSLNVSPRHDSFSVSVYHVDSSFDSQILHTVYFLAYLTDSEVFELESVIAFFQGLLDTGRVMVQASEPHDEPEQQPVSHPLDETADDFSYYIALLSPETADKNRCLAEHWWEETEYRYQGGLVIVSDGEATGWINQLRDPNHWEPGVIAVDEHGNQYQAIGGDSYNGATSWQPVWNIQPLKGAAA